MAAIHAFNGLEFLNSLASVALAFFLGMLIGSERQYRQRTAGLRTNVLVSVGAAAFVDLGMRLTGNPGAVQVVAYVVSGVGFLGAGVIMKEGMNVRGLNTAATLWSSRRGRSLLRRRSAGRGHLAHDLHHRREHVPALSGQFHQSHSD